MLPTHVFADVVAWLRFYDLGALLLTDARCSDLAHSAASKIRLFDFSEFRFDLYDTEIFVYKPAQPANSTTRLNFHGTAELAEFVPAALRNCVLGDLDLTFEDSSLIREANHTIIIKGTLLLNADIFVNKSAMVDFAVSFRSVQRVFISTAWSETAACAFDDAQIGEFVNLFDRHDFVLQTVDREMYWVTFVSRSA